LVAAASAYHFREHLPPNHAIDYKTIRAKCPEYGLLGDVVNASKHAVLTKGKPSLNDATDICEVVIVTEYADELGVYQDVDKVIRLSLKDGTQRNLHDVLRCVVNFWIDHLTSLGLINPRSPFVEPPRVAPSRDEAGCGPDGAARMDLEAVQGLPFTMQMQLMRFQISAGVALENTQTGEVHSRKVTLTVEESTKLSRCRTDEEKNATMKQLPTVQSAYADLCKELGIPRATNPGDEGTNTDHRQAASD
jgi:hypothetical protein